MIKNNQIKNLVFDFGGVLVDLNRQRCIEHFKRLGATGIEGLLGDYSKQGFFQDFEIGQISPAQFRMQLCGSIGKTLSDKVLDEAWNSFLEGIPVYKLEKLLQLRRHYVVYLLSNTNKIHWDWSCARLFRYSGHTVDDFFEKIFLSFEMRDAKPSSSIFQTVLSDTGIRAEDTLFLDDSTDNCAAAHSLGICTRLIDPREDWTVFFDQE